MENKITNLKISNFKSIREAELECGRINLFVGKPNTGKSNVLEAISLLGAYYNRNDKFMADFIRYEEVSNLFHFQKIEHGVEINTNIGNATIEYIPEAGIFDYIHFPDRTEQKLHTFSSKGAGSAQIKPDGSLEGQILTFEFVKKYVIKPLSTYIIRERNFLFPPFGDNLFSVVQSNTQSKEEIPGLFEEYGFEFLIDNKNSTFHLLRKQNRIAYKIPYSLIADTLQRIIFHYAAIFSNKDSVILFEEPESHSFPPYVSDLAYKISQDTENQYFITTHSPHLFTRIVEETPAKEVAVFIVYFENFETKFKKLTTEDISELLNYGIDIFFNAKYFLNETVSENPS